MLNIGGPELLIILLVALVFLGPQRLPDVARQLGQTMSTLRSLASGFQAEIDAASRQDDATSMTLEGPTDQAEAIAKTQAGGAGWAVDKPFEAVGTDTEALKEAARNVDPFSGEAKSVSAGGPTDLRVPEDVDIEQAVDASIEDAADADVDGDGDEAE